MNTLKNILALSMAIASTTNAIAIESEQEKCVIRHAGSDFCGNCANSCMKNT